VVVCAATTCLCTIGVAHSCALVTCAHGCMAKTVRPLAWCRQHKQHTQRGGTPVFARLRPSRNACHIFCAPTRMVLVDAGVQFVSCALPGRVPASLGVVHRASLLALGHECARACRSLCSLATRVDWWCARTLVGREGDCNAPAHMYRSGSKVTGTRSTERETGRISAAWGSRTQVCCHIDGAATCGGAQTL
jgi:hypothetical protein